MRNNRFITNEYGFTLFELLIVIVILGIVASFVLLATGDFGRSRRIEASTSQFKQLVQMAEQQAILASEVIALNLTPNGYQFYQYEKEQWQALPQNSLLAYHSWPIGVRATVSSSNSSVDDAAKSLIIISPSGNLTPFSLYLKTNGKTLFSLQGLADGEIKVKKLL